MDGLGLEIGKTVDAANKIMPDRVRFNLSKIAETMDRDIFDVLIRCDEKTKDGE